MAHALTFQHDFLREHRAVLAVSALLHLTLLVLLALNLNLLPRTPPQPVRLAIQATVVVDDRAARQRAADAQRRRQQAELAEQSRQEREAAQREAEARHLAAEQQRAAQERQAQQAEELRRKADADARLREQARAKADAEAKARIEAAARADAEARAAAQARARAQAEQRRARSQADLARQMAEEEALTAVAGSPAAAQYRDLIAQKVRRNWNEPASARPGDSCDVRVQQIPGGEVVSAVAFNCTGDGAFARSVEAAVLRSSPLPLPADPRLFDRNLLFTFKPEQ